MPSIWAKFDHMCEVFLFFAFLLQREDPLGTKLERELGILKTRSMCFLKRLEHHIGNVSVVIITRCAVAVTPKKIIIIIIIIGPQKRLFFHVIK